MLSELRILIGIRKISFCRDKGNVIGRFCLLVCELWWAKAKEVPFYCLQSIPPHFFCVGMASAVLVFLLSALSIVSYLLISNAVCFSLAIFMDLGKNGGR